jgi:hypothetical protein
MFHTLNCRIPAAVVLLAAMPIAAQMTPKAPAAGPTGYVINFSGQFGTLDLGTGTFAAIGTGTANTPDGLAGAPGGPFYTVDGITGHLLRIAVDGTVTDVGDTGTGANEGPHGISLVGSLTTGALYALDFSNRLFSINGATGALTLLGTLPLPPQESSYIGNMTTSLNGNDTHLFYTLEISEGPNTTGPTLFEIDPVTLRTTSTRLKNLRSRIIGAGFIANGMCAFTEFGEVVTVNTVSGVANATAEYDSGSTADDPGPPFTGIFGVIAKEPGTIQLGGRAVANGRGCLGAAGRAR